MKLYDTDDVKALRITKLSDGKYAGRMFAKVTPVEGSETKLNHLGGVGVIEVWASTEMVDRDNEIVRADSFTKSVETMVENDKFPPFLAAHMHVLSDGSVPVLGGVVPGSVKILPGKGMKCQVAFVSEKVNPHAPEWFEGYRVRAIRDVSVGFRAHRIKLPEKQGDKLEVLELDWLELSGAAVGSNPTADVISVSAKSVSATLSADGADYSDAVKNLLGELQELGERQAKDCHGCKANSGYKRDGNLVTIDLSKARRAGNDRDTLAAWLKDEHDEIEELQVEFREDDDAVVAQIADPEADYQEGTLREIELVGGDMPVKATVGVLVDAEAESITWLMFPKADGWTMELAMEWLESADLDQLLSDALAGENDEDEERSEHEDEDKDKDKDKQEPEGGCPEGTEWCPGIGECVPIEKHARAHALPGLLPKVMRPTLLKLEKLVARQERATANAEAMQTAMQTMTARAATLLDTITKVVGAVPSTSKSVKSVAPGHDADATGEEAEALSRIADSLEETLALRDAGAANSRA